MNRSRITRIIAATVLAGSLGAAALGFIGTSSAVHSALKAPPLRAYKDPTGDDAVGPSFALKAPPLRG